MVNEYGIKGEKGEGGERLRVRGGGGMRERERGGGGGGGEEGIK